MARHSIVAKNSVERRSTFPTPHASIPMSAIIYRRTVVALTLFGGFFAVSANAQYVPTPPAYGRVDRYAEVRPDWQTVWGTPWKDQCCHPKPSISDVDGLPTEPAKKCPLCEESPKTPCGECKQCKAGFPCERTLCRHCVQPRSMFMCNFCDLSGGDEPCGTCDACREHRSDPCEHADDGHGPRGEFNPYHEPVIGAVLPRPLVDLFNNGARKFPVYYNPAPYYRPHWNPSLFAGYARPFTFRWSCPLCFKDPCDCAKPAFAGQVPYAYSCKFCNRNPCSCAADICNVTKPLNPEGIAKSLVDEKQGSTLIQDTHRNKEQREQEDSLRDIQDDDDAKPLRLRDSDKEPAPKPRPILDAPEENSTPQRPGAVGRVS